MYAPSLGELARAALEEGAAGLGPLLPAPPLPGRADAGEPGRRRGGGARAARRGGLRVQARRRAAAGPPRGRRGARLHAPAAGRDGARARGRGVGEGAAGAGGGRRGRGAGPAPRREAEALPGDDAPARTEQGRRGGPRARCRCRPSSSTCCYLEGEGPLVSMPYAQRVERLPRLVEPGRAPAAPRDPRRGGGRALLRAGARGRPRGPDGEVARRALRGGPARLPLAEAEAGAHARPRDPRRREGERPAAGLALEPAPGRARRGERRSSSCSARRSRA